MVLNKFKACGISAIVLLLLIMLIFIIYPEFFSGLKHPKVTNGSRSGSQEVAATRRKTKVLPVEDEAEYQTSFEAPNDVQKFRKIPKWVQSWDKKIATNFGNILSSKKLTGHLRGQLRRKYYQRRNFQEKLMKGLNWWMTWGRSKRNLNLWLDGCPAWQSSRKSTSIYSPTTWEFLGTWTLLLIQQQMSGNGWPDTHRAEGLGIKGREEL